MEKRKNDVNKRVLAELIVMLHSIFKSLRCAANILKPSVV
jgi:hypothetical protein